MGEFASKGVAGTGLGLGIAGTALGLLNNNNGLGNGLLGGLFGNNTNMYANQASALMAENAMLKAENYSDKVGKEVYAQALKDNKELSDRVFDRYIDPMAKEIADSRVREASMAAEIKCIKETSDLKEKLFNARINEVALISNNGITALQGQVNCLSQTVNGITKVIVPKEAICPEYMNRYNSWTAPSAEATTP